MLPLEVKDMYSRSGRLATGIISKYSHPLPWIVSVMLVVNESG